MGLMNWVRVIPVGTQITPTDPKSLFSVLTCVLWFPNSSSPSLRSKLSLIPNRSKASMEEYSFADNENMNEDVEQSFPRKRKRKAPVWDNFEVTLISGEDKAICKHCGKILSAKASHGTNSLNTHVKSCKGLQSQSIRSEGSQGTVRMGQFDKTHETNAKTELANMIIMHEYPLSMVEHLGFKRYSKALQPSFKVPCRNTIKKEIMKIFEFEKEKTMKLI